MELAETIQNKTVFIDTAPSENPGCYPDCNCCLSFFRLFSYKRQAFESCVRIKNIDFGRTD